MKRSILRKSVRNIWIMAILFLLLSGIMNFAYFSIQGDVVLDGIRYSKEECEMAKTMIEDYYSGRRVSSFYEEENALSLYLMVLRQVREDRRVIIGWKVYREEEVQEVLSTYPYSIEQAGSVLSVVQLCERRLNRVLGYDNYVKKIQKNISNYKNVSIFSNGTRNLFVKANKDFYGLENLELRACVDAGILKYLDGKVGLLIGILFAISAGLIFRLQFQEGTFGETFSLGRGGSIWWYVFAVLFGSVGIFGAEMAAAEWTWGLEELFRPIQSIDRFYSCADLYSVAALLLLRFFFRCLLVMTVFFLCVFLFSLKRKWVSILFGGAILLTEGVLDRFGIPFSLYGQGFAENCFGAYNNVILFDKPMPAGILLTIVAIFEFACAAFLAARQARIFRLEARERAERQYFEQVDEKYAQARLLRHDMNNHLSAVAMLLKEGKTTDAQSYLEGVMQELDSTKPPVRTGIGVLDAVLMGKDGKAKENGIRLTMEFDPVLLRVGIPDYELCSLFGNLLDNCLEACEHLPEKDRWASLKVTRQMDMVCIFCENPYKELKRENGRFVSHKGDAVNHGLGIRQMERIAAKHGGTLEIDTKDRIFAVSILFSMEGA